MAFIGGNFILIYYLKVAEETWHYETSSVGNLGERLRAREIGWATGLNVETIAGKTRQRMARKRQVRVRPDQGQRVSSEIRPRLGQGWRVSGSEHVSMWAASAGETRARTARTECASVRKKGKKKRTMPHLSTCSESILFLLLWLVRVDIVTAVLGDVFDYKLKKIVTKDPGPFEVSCCPLRKFLLGLCKLN
jgi:hypothetical protein